MPPDERDPGVKRAGSSRRLPRWLLIAAGALLVARIGTGVYEERHPPRVADTIRWHPIAEALSEARQAKKPILYDFTADWCAPCQAMKREVFADAAAARQIETLFVPVRVLDRQREEGRNPPEVDSLQQRFHIDSFPTLVVAWPDSGQPTILSGYRGKAMTIQQLSQAVFLRSGLHGSVRFP